MKYLLLFILFSFNTFGQVFKRVAFRIDSLPKQGILLDKGWKWHAGDNPDFAKPDFDDSAWQTIDPTKDIMDLPQIQDGRIGWIRLKLKIDSSLLSQPFFLQIHQVIASEIYSDGRLIERFGVLNSEQVKAMYVAFSSISLPKNSTDLVIAVRFAIQKAVSYKKYGNSPNYCFKTEIIPFETIEVTNNDIKNRVMSSFAMASAFFIIFLLHLAFYIFFPQQKTNLYFAGMALFYGIHPCLWGTFLVILPIENLEFLMYGSMIRMLSFSIAYFLLLIALYSVFNLKKDFIFWITLCFSITLLLAYFLNYRSGYAISETGTPILNTFILLYIIRKAVLEKKRNAHLILIGMVCSIIGLGFRYLIYFGVIPQLSATVQIICEFVGIISIPICLSWFLGGDFAFINRNLIDKLKEVHSLSEEKQQILSAQNEILEKKVEERTAELNKSLTELKATQNQLIQKEKLASLGELTAGIAHEIQNPLNFVNNFSEVSVELIEELSEERKKEEGKRDIELENELLNDVSQNLQKIAHHGKRASNIVKGMLEHSRSSTGERVLTDINQLADEYLRLSFHGMKAKNKEFNADYQLIADENLPKIEVVPQEIGRVILNLINNAFQSPLTPNGGTLETKKVIVKTQYIPDKNSPSGGRGALAISVADNGNGIPDSIKEKIFQPFFTTKPTGEGTGLGLSLSHDIVTKGHGGTMEVISVEGEGAEFIVKLPT